MDLSFPSRASRTPGRRAGLPALIVGVCLVALAGCGPETSAGGGRADAIPPREDPLPAHPAAPAETPDPGSGTPAGVADGGDGASAEEAGAGEAGEDVPAESAPSGDPASATPGRVPAPSGEPPTFRRPEHVRGLYLNAWASGSSRRIEALLDVARRTEINAFVIDIKDASGYVSHRTRVPLAHEVGATGELRIGDLPGLLRRLSEEGIWPIARIVIVKDPILVEARPDLAVQDTAGGVWVDGKGIRWLNPYHPEVVEYHLDLAMEVAALGFPEIQWDYVRFPDAPRHELERAVFPGSDGVSKSMAIRDLLRTTRDALKAEHDVEVTADVFGVTTTARDVGIGQVWEDFIDVVDVALPMVYPSHYWRGSYGIQTPNAYPYEIVRRAMEDALARSRGVEGAGAVRPWIQAFTLGQPPYGPPEVRAQIEAAYDVGIHEWILWNPSSRYDEAALEPVGGFTSEPLIRIAGRVVPVSEGKEIWRLARAEAEAAARVAADSARAGESGDTLDAAPVDADTLPVTAPPLPGVPAPRDTIPGDSVPVVAPNR